MSAVGDRLQIEYVSLSRLKPFDGNPRQISEAGLEKLQRSVEEFGFVNPIIAQCGTDMVIAGHQRIKAAQAAGLIEVPVVWLDVDDVTAKAYNIADNRIAEEAEWDFGPLANLLTELDSGAFDLSLTGFDDDEIERMMNWTPDGDGEIEQDEVPEPPDDPVTKLGDLWILGRHRLLCGDSANQDDVEHLIDGNQASIIVYDPPFDMPGAYEHIPANDGHGKLLVFWDYRRVANAILGAVAVGWKFLYEFIWDGQTSWYTHNRPLMRHKGCGLFGDDERWHFDDALYQDDKKRTAHVVTNTRGSYQYVPNPKGTHLQTVFSSPITQEFDGHPHAKPVQWVKALLAGCGEGVVLDLFGGSGTSVIAAEQNKQTALVMEIDPRNCDVIVRRWENATGGIAQKAN